MDWSADKLIGESNPSWLHYRRMVANFGDNETVLIYLRAEDLWTYERLRELERFTLDIEKPPGIESVDSLFTAHYGNRFGFRQRKFSVARTRRSARLHPTRCNGPGR